MAFGKVSDNGLFLYGLDIFRFEISIHTIKLDVQKSTLAKEMAENGFEEVSENGFEEVSENGFEEVSDNGLLLYGLYIFKSQIFIHTLKLDVQKKYSTWRIYQTVAFEKTSENGLSLYGLDIFRFQVSIHTLKLDVP